MAQADVAVNEVTAMLVSWPSSWFWLSPLSDAEPEAAEVLLALAPDDAAEEEAVLF